MYEEKTPEAIKAAIKEDITLLDTREGSYTDDIIAPTAVELSNIYASLNGVQHIIWVDENSGEYLDMAAADIGIEPRKAGDKALVTLQITGAAGYTVPAGAAFLTLDNLYFETTQAVTLPPEGIALIPARAQKVGALYNVAAESITLQFANDARISAVTNPEAAEGGADPETDAALFERIDDARKKPSTSGNKYDYEKWAKETSGIGAAKIFPLHDGPGTVLVVVAGPDRMPVDDVTVQKCAAHIEEVRPIGASVTVRSAQALEVNVAASALIEEDANPGEVQAAFVAALTEYLADVAFVEASVIYSRVGGLLISVPGMVDYSGLTLNGEPDSIALGDEQIPVVGEVALTWI